ncbi:MAG TPA: hypothetical protein VFK89_11955 [Actinomycetota bacterium]|nr:hypothetical protein [Actinomycetota bacterium]
MERTYCPRCRADVDNVEGFCLLGHRLPVEVEDHIADLRDAVDAAFNRVEVDIKELSTVPAAVVSAVVPPAAPISAPVPPSAPVQPTAESLTPAVFRSLDASSDHEVVDRMAEAKRSVWAELSVDRSLPLDDPIVSFAPSPRMDWGPARSGRRRRR